MTYSNSNLVRAPNQRSRRLVLKSFISLPDKSLQQKIIELLVYILSYSLTATVTSQHF